MTAQEAIIEVYERLGEPSDLPIYGVGGAFSIIATGSVRILAALNRACDYVAMFKLPTTPNGRPLYFRALYKTLVFESTELTCTLPTQTDATFKTLLLDTTLSGSNAGRFIGWIASVGEEDRRVVRHTVTADVATIVLDVPLAEDVSAETLTLRPRAFSFSGTDALSTSDRVAEVLGIVDLANGVALERSVDALGSAPASVGTPSAFAKKGDGFVFDCASDDTTCSYEVEYIAFPTACVAASDVFALPLAFHDAIVTWTTRWGYSRMMETQSAYAAKRDFEDMMRTLQTQIDMEDFVGGDYISPQMEA